MGTQKDQSKDQQMSDTKLDQEQLSAGRQEGLLNIREDIPTFNPTRQLLRNLTGKKGNDKQGSQ